MQPIKVKHSELERASENSRYKSNCPSCPDGVLPVRRHTLTYELEEMDFCLGCGQAFIYEDIEQVRGI